MNDEDLISPLGSRPHAHAPAAPNDVSPTKLPDWRLFAGIAALAWAAAFLATLTLPGISNSEWPGWLVGAGLHLPYVGILIYLALGTVERVGYLGRRRSTAAAGRLPEPAPLVCVQLPMFNEAEVAVRAIEAAAALRWPAGRLEVQVLDDSTDAQVRDLVRRTCVAAAERTGVAIRWIHRTDRAGYKAGALEAGRRQTQADFIAILDADFVPHPDFLERMVPSFYRPDGSLIEDLALVQAQWGHLNDDRSALTAAQAMWVDDHHTLQMSWRSAALGFVNFTGTAGVWRADAIADAGGWKAASLVEDCELSFRVLFCGWRTRFDQHAVVPAELPDGVAAYRLQQRRWTQGWVQLQRLHLRTLATGYPSGLGKRIMLLHMMCIGWQWPLWALWVCVLPFLVAHDLWLGAFGIDVAVLVYLAPPLWFSLFVAWLATSETNATYADRPTGWRNRMARFARVVPYLAVNAAMLPHHLCAFIEGLFGPMHAEFERTPKTASSSRSGAASHAVPVGKLVPAKATWRQTYLIVEAAAVVMNAAWTVYFVLQGNYLAALGAFWFASCTAALRTAQTLDQLRRAGGA